LVMEPGELVPQPETSRLASSRPPGHMIPQKCTNRCP
jgi:hypothetical protein